MARAGTPWRLRGLVFALCLFVAAPAWPGPVYNVTELHVLSGSSLDSADLVSLFYAGFRFTADQPAADNAAFDAPELPETVAPDALAADERSADRLFPINGFLSGDTDAVLYITGFIDRDPVLFTPAGQMPRLPCEQAPVGLALALCPPPEHTAPEQQDHAGENPSRFRCGLYARTTSPPDYLCALPWDR